ncbi:MAG: phosphomannomutase/phosphoglucomutase [Xanthomonadales bacterium]|jgi:phosphomannomutase/phosphoglucomutase|nr:phosphomannomutase/phosphoglucomutase [Xanthomonadales bacterium]
MDIKAKLPEFIAAGDQKRVHPVVVILLGAIGVFVIAAAVWLYFSDSQAVSRAEKARAQGQIVLEQIIEPLQRYEQSVNDPQVQALALNVMENPAASQALLDWLREREPAVRSVEVFRSEEIDTLVPDALGANGYAKLDLAMSVIEGKKSLVQIHGVLDPPMLFDAIPVQEGGQTLGVLVISADPSLVIDPFHPEYSELGFVRLAQYNGRQPLTVLKEFGDPSRAGDIPERLLVPGTMLRVEIPQVSHVSVFGENTFLLLVAAGLLSIAGAIGLFVLSRKQGAKEEISKPAVTGSPAEPAQAIEAVPGESAAEASREETPEDPASAPGKAVQDADFDRPAAQEPEPEAVPQEMHLRYDIEERRRQREAKHEPVALDRSIFRAYDIRGVIDKTLDSGIARKIGQAVGSRVLEDGSAPVVVARDGRLSGPYLMEGLVEGLLSTGCDVIDIGAVPTGVLYYAAHEFASGSGVMITGSHNPPDYNGLKIMVGGDTLYGNAIMALHDRIVAGDLKVGEGKVEQRDVLPDYIQRIVDDVKIEKPLRVVLDCGNGIGGVCAPDVLRALGAEVLPLYDEVDGTFPNHHPDPSEPENLKDLIESVRLMDADLGLALDGDADRLGVVTLAGDIIYPDRILMLLSLDVLDRNPGATILFDVKCSAHLPRVISEAGGKPMMYKTGHSLMKAKMKEIGAPFGGEMSGHFFFGERWYGVDDGIYAAARLLEILGGTETPPEAILGSLPASFSTPELKVGMDEGENHPFVEAFTAAATEAARIGGLFEGAEITTIDGLRADFKDGWGLVRASNTTPVLVVRFDADSEDALSRIKELFRAQILALRSDLDLPF